METRMRQEAAAGRCLCSGGAVVWALLRWSLPDAGLLPEGASGRFGRAQGVAPPMLFDPAQVPAACWALAAFPVG